MPKSVQYLLKSILGRNIISYEEIYNKSLIFGIQISRVYSRELKKSNMNIEGRQKEGMSTCNLELVPVNLVIKYLGLI